MNLYSNQFFTYLFWRFVLRRPKFRQFLTNFFYPDETVDIGLFGSTLCINKRKEIGYWNAYSNSSSNVVFRDESGPLLSLALILAPGDVFLDIGANVGLYSCTLAKITSAIPSIKFVAFEPNLDTFKRLQESARGKNVQIFNCALSNKAGMAHFFGGATSGVFGIAEKAGGHQIKGKKFAVECRPLDSFGFQDSSLVMKIDVEGHEMEVLEGAQSYFQKKQVKAVFIDGFKEPRIPEFLKGWNFDLFDGSTMKPFHTGNRQLLALRKDFERNPFPPK